MQVMLGMPAIQPHPCITCSGTGEDHDEPRSWGQLGQALPGRRSKDVSICWGLCVWLVGLCNIVIAMQHTRRHKKFWILAGNRGVRLVFDLAAERRGIAFCWVFALSRVLRSLCHCWCTRIWRDPYSFASLFLFIPLTLLHIYTIGAFLCIDACWFVACQEYIGTLHSDLFAMTCMRAWNCLDAYRIHLICGRTCLFLNIGSKYIKSDFLICSFASGKMGPKMQLPDNVVVHEPKVGKAALHCAALELPGGCRGGMAQVFWQLLKCCFWRPPAS